MPVAILALVAAMMTIVVSFVVWAAWERLPAARWFAGGYVVLIAGLIVAARMHMRAARADIADGIAQIKTGRATNKRTGGRRVTWYYTTIEGIGEVEVSREQYDVVAIGSTYTVSYSPRVHRAWTIDPSGPHSG